MGTTTWPGLPAPSSARCLSSSPSPSSTGASPTTRWPPAWAPLALPVWRLDAPEVESSEEPIDRADVAALLRRPEVVGMAAAMFFGTGVEGGLFIWLPTYANGELPANLASITLSVMIAGYVPARFLYGRIGDRIGYLRLLLPILVALVPLFYVTFVYADGLWILLCVALIGAGIGGIFPLLISYATEAVPHHSGPVTAIAAVASSLGVGSVPAVMGVVISGSDARLAMQLLLRPARPGPRRPSWRPASPNAAGEAASPDVWFTTTSTSRTGGIEATPSPTHRW